MWVLCAWCRQKVRDQSSREWTPVTVLPDESKASHGMCPQCFDVQQGLLVRPKCSTPMETRF